MEKHSHLKFSYAKRNEGHATNSLQAKTDTNDKQCVWDSKINEPLTSLNLGLIKQGLKHIIFAHEQC
jgi:hypothetical protein